MRREIGQRYVQQEVREQSRWSDSYADQRQSVVLFDLIAKENARARRIAHHVDDRNTEKAQLVADESVSPFQQLNELLAFGTLLVKLENSNDEEILAHHQGASMPFSIAQMSDGERNAAIIAATVLTVEPGTVLLIDEPERHLHRSIIEPFLSALFEYRGDCVFVVSTHEIALPVANPEARVLMVRSCQWRGNAASAWDVKVLEAHTDLPEDLKLAIWGSWGKILFVEGDSHSLDLPLYNALFPGLSVVPKGSCSDVERAVKGLRSSYDLHHVEALGLIDRDNRTEDDVKQLAADSVFALQVWSAESLYYCSDAVAAVAHRQAESLGHNADEMIESATRKALDALAQDGLAERMAARRCERQVRDRMLSQLPDWRSIKTNSGSEFRISMESPYADEVTCFKKLVAGGELDDLVARYPLRESNVFKAISQALECTSRNTYEQTLLTRLRDDMTLQQSLKKRIGPLAAALTNQTGSYSQTTAS